MCVSVTLCLHVALALAGGVPRSLHPEPSLDGDSNGSGPDYFAYTDFHCIVNATQAGTPCASSRSNPTQKLKGALKRMHHHSPHAHILIFGPSYLREVANAIIRAAHSGGKTRAVGENNDKLCYCGLKQSATGSQCPCNDYAVTKLHDGITVTNVFNYQKLQTEANRAALRSFLRTESFSHAIVMEPHEPCYFTICDGHGACPGCQMDKDGRYGCGWSHSFWEIFEAAFPQNGTLAHVVPWYITDGYQVGGEAHAVRTRSLVEETGCEAEPQTANGVNDPTRPSRGRLPINTPTFRHQCLVVCDASTVDHRDGPSCRDGTPASIAERTLNYLIENGSA